MKPNIFRVTTKELSQDAFFTWLLQWTGYSGSQPDGELQATAQDFVRLLIGQTELYPIKEVIAGKQWHDQIDIWADRFRW